MRGLFCLRPKFLPVGNTVTARGKEGMGIHIFSEILFFSISPEDICSLCGRAPQKKEKKSSFGIGCHSMAQMNTHIYLYIYGFTLFQIFFFLCVWGGGAKNLPQR
jgi:hypothetical protein